MSLIKSFFSICIYLLFAAYANADGVLEDMSGHKISLSDLQGKWVFINYWASWCRPCVDEIPVLNHFYEENKDNNVVVFAVNYDGLPLHKQQKLIKKFDIHYPSLKQDPATVLQLGDVRGVPVTFVFTPQGELRDTMYGGQTIGSLKNAMAP